MKNLSIQFEILIIPIVGVIDFVVYLAITFSTMNTIDKLLKHAKRLSFRN